MHGGDLHRARSWLLYRVWGRRIMRSSWRRRVPLCMRPPWGHGPRVSGRCIPTQSGARGKGGAYVRQSSIHWEVGLCDVGGAAARRARRRSARRGLRQLRLRRRHSGSPAASTSDILRVASLYSVTTWDPSASYSTEVDVHGQLLRAAGLREPGRQRQSRSHRVWPRSGPPPPDGLSWTFKLREGVTFHDGTPFNADAVKYSIDRTMKLNLGAAYLLSQIKDVKVVDDYTVKFVLSSPAPIDRIMSGDYAVWMFSPATEGKDQAWWDKGNEAGTGPYVLESYTADQEAVFTANPDWWGGWKDNQFKKVVVQFVGDAGTQRQLLESGAVDTINHVARDQVDALKANPDLVVYTGPSSTRTSCSSTPSTSPSTTRNCARRYRTPSLPPTSSPSAPRATGRGPRAPSRSTCRQHRRRRPASTPPTSQGQAASVRGRLPRRRPTLNLTYTPRTPTEDAYTPLIKEAYAKVGVKVNVRSCCSNGGCRQGRGTRPPIARIWPSTCGGRASRTVYDNLVPMFRPEEERRRHTTGRTGTTPSSTSS